MAEKKDAGLAMEDLYRLELITQGDLSPDGRWVVFDRQWVDRETEKRHANLWVVPVAGGTPRQFTRGDSRDRHPRWSPKGDAIAFLSNRDGDRAQIYLIPADGGEARRVTDLKGRIYGFAWSPEGQRMAVVFREEDPEALAREDDERKKELGVTARRVVRSDFKLDGEGYLPLDRKRVWVVDLETGEAAPLTGERGFDERSPCWTPDGERIVFCSNRQEKADLHPHAVDLFVAPAAGGEPERIPAPFGPKDHLSLSPDGELLAWLGREGKGDWWRHTCVWVAPLDAAEASAARNLTAALDVHVGNVTINDLGGMPTIMPPAWSSDGSRLFFQVSRQGDTQLWSLPVAGGSPETVIEEPGVVEAFWLGPESRRVVYLFGSQEDPGQIWVNDMQAGRAEPLTHVNADWLREVELGEVEEVWFEGAAGNALQGWILKPPGFDPARRYPAILEIHGGPLTQYGRLFMHEFYVLAARGYVVLYSNPRGGRGYGEEHARAIWNAWGTADYDDLMAWADFAAARPEVDDARMGVAGGSYGGYMTNWIIGHTGRFQAAVTQRSVSNLISMWGTSDFNWVFQEAIGDDLPPWENFESYWDRSPLKYIGNAKTPTLVIHSEKDQRCEIEQGEQIFVALRTLGVDTEMVRFPEEPHGLSREGRTDRRVVRLNHILRWFDRYLGTPC